MVHALWLVGWLATSLCANAQAPPVYNLFQSYSGSTFFDGWQFYNGQDVNTTGNVIYQDGPTAMQQNLAFVNPAGNAIIKVDNVTQGGTVPGFNRSSVKILSNLQVKQGSLIIMDAVHMPYGCSVWPAFWLCGENWPFDGEIDIIENVNLATTNQYGVHTTPGCNHPDPPPPGTSAIDTGHVLRANCTSTKEDDEGCPIQEAQPNSFGAGFASIGGGVYATLWDAMGMRLWFFPRSAIPANVNSDHPDPSVWPTPSAFWPTSTCNLTQFFGPQTMIIDITLCGSFANAAGGLFNRDCQGQCTDLISNPANYDNAYFEIPYIKVYLDATTIPASSSSAPSSTPAQTAGSEAKTPSGPAAASSSPSGKSSAAPESHAARYVTVLAAVLLPLLVVGLAIVP